VADYDPANGHMDENVREILWRYGDNPAGAEDEEELPDAPPPAVEHNAAPQPAAPAAQNSAPVADVPQATPVQDAEPGRRANQPNHQQRERQDQPAPELRRRLQSLDQQKAQNALLDHLLNAVKAGFSVGSFGAKSSGLYYLRAASQHCICLPCCCLILSIG
jgi:hypothetical protein